MQTNSGKNLEVLKLTPETYQVPKGEESKYHVVIEVTQFDQKKGTRLSIPRVQKFGPKAWKTYIERNLKLQGYDITILHDPTQWMATEGKKQAEAQKAFEEQKRADAAAAQQKAIDDAVAAALEKQNAENQKAIDAAVAAALAKQTAKEPAAKADTNTEAKQVSKK